MSIEETQKFVNEVQDIIEAMCVGLEDYIKKMPARHGNVSSLLCAAMLNTSISMEQFKKAGGTNEDIVKVARIAAKLHHMYKMASGKEVPPQVDGAVA